MADPFEVRMRFSSQLEHLNASTTSAQKAAQYALKYKDMDEDLHSCILEQLEKVGLVLHSLSVVHRRGKMLTSPLPRTDQHEHASEHHVLHRAPARDGLQGKTQRLRAHDAARHYQSRRCRVPGEWIWRSQRKGGPQGTASGYEGEHDSQQTNSCLSLLFRFSKASRSN